DRLRAAGGDAGGDPVALRGGTRASDLGHPGTGGAGEVRPADARRDDRRGDGRPRRVRDAEQGPQRRRGGHRAARTAATDDRTSGEEDLAAAGAALVVSYR